MQLWIKVLIIVFLFLFAFLVYNYLRFSFIMKVAKGEKLKKGTKEEIGLFLYVLKHDIFKPAINPFLKDTVKVVFDSLIISGLVLSIINREWFYAILLITLRLFIFMDQNKFNNKMAAVKHIEKDAKSFKEFMKKRNKK